MSCRTTHPGPSAAALRKAVSLGPAWGTRRHFGSLNGHGPTDTRDAQASLQQMPSLLQDPRTAIERCPRHEHSDPEARTGIDQQHRRDLHEEISAVSPARAPSLPCPSNGPPFRCITEPVPQHNPYTDCDADTPRKSRSDCAPIAVHHGCSAGVVQASCYWRVVGVLLRSASWHPVEVSLRPCRAKSRGRALTRPHDYLEHHSEWPDGRLADHAPPEAHLAQAVSQRLRSHLTDHNPSLRQAARLAAASRQGTVQRRPRTHLERPRNSRAHRARTRHRLVGH